MRSCLQYIYIHTHKKSTKAERLLTCTSQVMDIKRHEQVKIALFARRLKIMVTDPKKTPTV